MDLASTKAYQSMYHSLSKAETNATLANDRVTSSPNLDRTRGFSDNGSCCINQTQLRPLGYTRKDRADSIREKKQVASFPPLESLLSTIWRM
jgi:hypothetical protein